jgi:hypothetical protein
MGSAYHHSSPPRPQISTVGLHITVECFQTDRIRWLVHRSRDEDAKQALRRLTSSRHADVSFKIHNTVVKMGTTNELEKAIESRVGYIDWFKGGNLRRTEIVCTPLGSKHLSRSFSRLYKQSLHYETLIHRRSKTCAVQHS